MIYCFLFLNVVRLLIIFFVMCGYMSLQLHFNRENSVGFFLDALNVVLCHEWANMQTCFTEIKTIKWKKQFSTDCSFCNP